MTTSKPKVSIQLTPDQLKAVESIIEFLDDADPDDYIFTMSGVGGAGKTTCIIEALRGRNDILGATVSHSAKAVLEESLGQVATCVTLAQLLGLRQRIDEDGQISFVPNPFQRNGKALPIDSAKILVIDECSMIDKVTFNRILSMKSKDCKVIFLGDVYQLPPIEGKEDSITFTYTRSQLHKPVRYTGPIADMGEVFRKEIDKINKGKQAAKHTINRWQYHTLGQKRRTSKLNEDGSGYIFLNDVGKAVDIAVNAFRNSDDPNVIRMIGYKNASIAKINDVTRAHLYAGPDGNPKDDLDQFMPGELVICDGGYSVVTNRGHGETFTHNAIYNGQTFRVKGHIPIKNGPKGVPSLAMDLEPHVRMPEGTEVYALDYENGRHRYFDAINSLSTAAKNDKRQWGRYYDYMSNWAKFDYAYALTSHKSQGRTFQDVIVFESDIMNLKKTSLKNKLQSLYVACTRAKRRVYIYNNEYDVDQSQLSDSIIKELGL